jgi:hAT family C-terminal dimerisation region
MAIIIFTIPPMSAGPERVFSGGKHTIAPERVRLGARMVEMAEYLKSWIGITPGRQQAPLSGVFANSRFVEEATKLLQEFQIVIRSLRWFYLTTDNLIKGIDLDCSKYRLFSSTYI